VLTFARRISHLSVAALALGLMTADPARADDDPPVTVTPGGFGIVETQVTDVGRPEKVDRARFTRPRLKPSRTCTVTKSPDAGRAATETEYESGAPPSAGPGGWVVRRCSDGSLDTAWVAQAPSVRAARVTPGQLAEHAVSRLRLPLPMPRFDPRRESSVGPATLVNVPTWFWVDGWTPAARRTQAGGVWAEVSAVPVETTWTPGDGGAPVRCGGPGIPWTSDRQSPAKACRYTYARSSAAQRGDVYLARVTVVWRVSWRGSGGLGGTLPLMERQSTFPVAVAERQTVVTIGGGS
jgi:hypothetical protein